MKQQFTQDQISAIIAAETELQQLTGESDIEHSHWRADTVVSTLLRRLGCDRVADIYDKLEKWYN